jgi:hypothetical protein
VCLAIDSSPDAVGALIGEDGQVFCTATLVAPRFIITAKHCIEGGSEDDPQDKKPETVEFRFGESVKAADGGVQLRRWAPEPEIATAKPLLVGDVTLAELAEPITTIKPVRLSLDAITEREIGNAFDVVGFGVQSPDGRGEVGGQREVGSLRLVVRSPRYGVRRLRTHDGDPPQARAQALKRVVTSARGGGCRGSRKLCRSDA